MEFSLPVPSPHCTHKMQPLDVGIYGPFKSRCKTAFNDYILSNPGKAITIYDIAQLTANPYLLSFTPLNITNAFRKCGIWAINSLVFNDSDFIVRAGNQNDNIKEFITSLLYSLVETVLDKVGDLAINQHKQFLSPKDQGRSKIYTSTPEKNEIELETQKREEKKLKTKSVKRNIVQDINGSSKVKLKNKNIKEQAKHQLPSIMEGKTSKIRSKPSKRKLSSSSSDSDASYEAKNLSSDSDIDMTEDYEN
ncbi:hypothetical protein NQ317_011216 [Molorchus minor]|uniref:Uncharacterized protein n=1 Tax=Molorchus minor TaxID=1323400 RepID=A0ABQ9JGQ0_9CUCU|nr:hypothetical protein NQ317_011216 [Molorchus minor]